MAKLSRQSTFFLFFGEFDKAAGPKARTYETFETTLEYLTILT